MILSDAPQRFLGITKIIQPSASNLIQIPIPIKRVVFIVGILNDFGETAIFDTPRFLF
ncbi:hypothetical protein [Sapientia aquatica]|uniref:hypothetical protein n=1 Tax=Sapientia aquatica TaxID=1549640 RepID=UPI001404AB6F|nr:hypothetical protein [Sapientia aquatica]